MMVAPLTPTELPPLVTAAPVKVTVPKLAKGTKLFPDEKSSTIHSALVSQSVPWVPPEAKVWLTDLPVERLWMVAVPEFLVVAVTVIWIRSPAEIGIPEKS